MDPKKMIEEMFASGKAQSIKQPTACADGCDCDGGTCKDEIDALVQRYRHWRGCETACSDDCNCSHSIDEMIPNLNHQQKQLIEAFSDLNAMIGSHLARIGMPEENREKFQDEIAPIYSKSLIMLLDLSIGLTPFDVDFAHPQIQETMKAQIADVDPSDYDRVWTAYIIGHIFAATEAYINQSFGPVPTLIIHGLFSQMAPTVTLFMYHLMAAAKEG